MSNRISGTVDRVFFTSAKFSAGALVRETTAIVFVSWAILRE